MLLTVRVEEIDVSSRSANSSSITAYLHVLSLCYFFCSLRSQIFAIIRRASCLVFGGLNPVPSIPLKTPNSVPVSFCRISARGLMRLIGLDSRYHVSPPKCASGHETACEGVELDTVEL